MTSIGFSDPRQELGALLGRVVSAQRKLSDLKRSMGSYAAAASYNNVRHQRAADFSNAIGFALSSREARIFLRWMFECQMAQFFDPSDRDPVRNVCGNDSILGLHVQRSRYFRLRRGPGLGLCRFAIPAGRSTPRAHGFPNDGQIGS